MTLLNITTLLLLAVGCGFFLAGAVGLVRFPDILSKLHALTKADNVGLGFIVAGLALQAETFSAVMKLILIWLAAMFASATICYLIASKCVDSNRGGYSK